MEITLIVLTSTLIATGFVGAYKLGIEEGRKQNKQEEKIEMNDTNKKVIKDLVDFMNYTGADSSIRKDDD